MDLIRLNNKLLDAALYGHTETVKALLAAGADVHAYDNGALRNAALYGHTETVKELLAAGADVESALTKAIKNSWHSNLAVNGAAFTVLEAKNGNY